jgi:hypothetical protein
VRGGIFECATEKDYLLDALRIRVLSWAGSANINGGGENARIERRIIEEMV